MPDQAALDNVVNKFGALEGGKQTLARLAEYVWDSLDAKSNPDQFRISRVINAPAELVWDAFTMPKHLANWLGPPGCDSATRLLDLRAGGRMHYSMKMPGSDMDHFGLWVFREVTPPSRLVFVSSFADEKGNVIRAFFNPDWPLEILSTITFEAHAGVGRGTLVTISGQPLNASPAELKAYRDHMGSMTMGWNGSFDRLNAYAPTMGK
ncbi:MAG: SRPBCC domain-containing protein [Tepidisphaera sp.]|nr:SRPBCC domain-containing protein [Tepidisphaera sp.]